MTRRTDELVAVTRETAEPRLACAVCLYARSGRAAPAVTVIEGYAVCDDHLGYVAQGERFASMLRNAKRGG